MRQYKTIIFKTETDQEPFTDWIESLDKPVRDRIRLRIYRIEKGNFGDCKTLKNGIFELRVHFGKGYRVYFGEHGKTIVLLLCGGDKTTQKKDILKAKDFWRAYNEKN